MIQYVSPNALTYLRGVYSLLASSPMWYTRQKLQLKLGIKNPPIHPFLVYFKNCNLNLLNQERQLCFNSQLFQNFNQSIINDFIAKNKLQLFI